MGQVLLPEMLKGEDNPLQQMQEAHERLRVQEMRLCRSLAGTDSLAVLSIRFCVVFMGEVIVVFRILPDSVEAFDSVKKQCEALKPDRLEE